MARQCRLFMADLHVGLTRNIHALQLKGLDLSIEDASMSSHWWVHHPVDPGRRWPLFRLWRRAIASGWYSFRRFEARALALAAVHGSHFSRHIDAVYVSFLPHLLHLYRYVDVPIILHASYRLGGTVECRDYPRLLSLIRDLHGEGRLAVTASNAYDAEYIRYFTGIDAEVITLDCGDTATTRWHPHPGLPFLMGPLHFSRGGDAIAASLRAALPDFHLSPMREAYPDKRVDLHEQFCRHPGVVIVPYSVHAVTITECLRSGIPLFCPTHRLLVEWHRTGYVVEERKSRRARGVVTYPKTLPGAGRMPNPDDDEDEAAYGAWLALCDWYAWPVALFDSAEDLRAQLTHADLAAMSERQLRFSAAERAVNASKWERLFAAALDGTRRGRFDRRAAV